MVGRNSLTHGTTRSLTRWEAQGNVEDSMARATLHKRTMRSVLKLPSYFSTVSPQVGKISILHMKEIRSKEQVTFFLAPVLKHELATACTIHRQDNQHSRKDHIKKSPKRKGISPSKKRQNSLTL